MRKSYTERSVEGVLFRSGETVSLSPSWSERKFSISVSSRGLEARARPVGTGQKKKLKKES